MRKDLVKKKAGALWFAELLIVSMFSMLFISVPLVSADDPEWAVESIDYLPRVIIWRFDDLSVRSTDDIESRFKGMTENVSDSGGYSMIAFVPGVNATYSAADPMNLTYTQDEISDVNNITLDDHVALAYHSWNHSEPYEQPWDYDLETQEIHMNYAIWTFYNNFGYNLTGWIGPGGNGNYNTTVLLEERGLSAYLIYTNTVATNTRFLNIMTNGDNCDEVSLDTANLTTMQSLFNTTYNKTNVIMCVGHPVNFDNQNKLDNFSAFVDWVYENYNLVNMDYEEAIDFKEDLFQIDSIEELDRVRLNQYYTAVIDENTFYLASDLDFDDDGSYENVSLKDNYVSGSGWKPINRTDAYMFNGLLDGRNHSISNLFIDRIEENYVGLFGMLRDNVGVQDNIINLKLLNVDIKGRDNVGSFFGKHSSEEPSLYNCYATGDIIGMNYTGGLCGYAKNITNSGCYVNITCLSYGGGITGYASMNITNSYARGNVSRHEGGTETSFSGFVPRVAANGDIFNCYSTGYVTYLGVGAPTGRGFVYQVDSGGTVTNSFWDNQTSGQTSSSGYGTGKNTSDMQTIATFSDADWDIGAKEHGTTVWYLTGDMYPDFTDAGPSLYLYVNGVSSTEANVTIGDTFNVTEYINLSGGEVATIIWTVNFTTNVNFTSMWLGASPLWDVTFFDPYVTLSNDTGDGTGSINQTSNGISCKTSDGYMDVINFTSQYVGTCDITTTYSVVSDCDSDEQRVNTYDATITIHPARPASAPTTSDKGTDYILLDWTQALPNGANYFRLYNNDTDTLLYSGTDTEYNHTGLSNDTYHYSLYSYNSTEGLMSLLSRDHSDAPSGGTDVPATIPTGYTYGNWSHSEHVVDETTDEDWSYADDSWSVENYSWWYGESMIETDLSLTSDPYNTFAILDDSGMNRSQSVGYIHFNASGEDPPFVYPYVIFSYNTSDDYYCIMWAEMPGDPGVWIVHYNGTGMFYLDGEECIDPVIDGEEYDLVEFDWQTESYWWYPDGMWYKLIYNSNSGYLNFKWWDNMYLMNEPIVWAVETYNSSLVIDEPRSYGLGVWNPYELDHKIQFDLINLWQLNRTVNASATMEMNGNTYDRPHMDFPVVDFGLYYELYYSSMEEAGNLSMDGIRDIMKEFTSYQNMEAITAQCEQYDNIYYYSMLFDNVTGGEELMYDEYLYLHIDMCPQGPTSAFEEVVVAIDVDDDGSWDLNDRLFIIYYDEFSGTTEMQYNGDNWVEPNYYASIWTSAVDGVANLHRYNAHMHAQVIIPLSELVKNTGYPLNASDIFGLSISNTLNDCDMFVTWQDWFEGDGYETYEYRQSSDMFYHFYGEEGPDPNLTEFGEGMIRGEFEGSGEIAAHMSINVSWDDTIVLSGENFTVVNATVWVNNTGSGELTNIIINQTWWNCSCSDLNMTLVDMNLSLDDVTWYNDSCYWVIEHTSLSSGESWSFYYVVNITACPGTTIATDTIDTTGIADELTSEVNSSDTIGFSWGFQPEIRVSYGLSPLSDLYGRGSGVLNLFLIVMVVIALGLALGFLLYIKKEE